MCMHSRQQPPVHTCHYDMHAYVQRAESKLSGHGMIIHEASGLVLHGESNRCQASPRTTIPCDSASANRKKQCRPNESKPHSNATHPRKRQKNPRARCCACHPHGRPEAMDGRGPRNRHRRLQPIATVQCLTHLLSAARRLLSRAILRLKAR